MNWNPFINNPFASHVIDATPVECYFCSTPYSKVLHAMPCNTERAQKYRFSQMSEKEQREELYGLLLKGKDKI